jgi:hypothetical protein
MAIRSGVVAIFDGPDSTAWSHFVGGLSTRDFSCPIATEFSMLGWLTHLDRLLRGDATRPEQLRDGRVTIDASGMAAMIVLLGMIYGLCMGSYSLLKEVPEALSDPNMRYKQLVATTLKVPALFYLTLLVTFPSLYVFNALVGSRLTVTNVLRLLVASSAVNLAVLASLGPIVLFFSLTTKSYAFIQLLNVVVFSVAGVLGLIFLRQTLHRLTSIGGTLAPAPMERGTAAAGANPEDTVPASGSIFTGTPSALDMPEGEAFGRHTRAVFACWMVVFALVGAQMAWVLRPFIGNPDLPFSWFRERKSNFFEAVLNALHSLFAGGG